MKIEMTENPASEDIRALDAGLVAHMHGHFSTPGFRPVAFFHRTADQSILGGIAGIINWNWAFVKSFWVTEDLRHKTLGSRLLEEFETYARAQGCEYIHLDTFSFQAPIFYERHGYEVFAVLKDYPPGHKRLFYKKALRRVV